MTILVRRSAVIVFGRARAICSWKDFDLMIPRREFDGVVVAATALERCAMGATRARRVSVVDMDVS